MELKHINDVLTGDIVRLDRQDYLVLSWIYPNMDKTATVYLTCVKCTDVEDEFDYTHTYVLAVIKDSDQVPVVRRAALRPKGRIDVVTQWGGAQT